MKEKEEEIIKNNKNTDKIKEKRLSFQQRNNYINKNKK